MNSLLLSLALLSPAADPVAKAPPEGVLPVGADGKPLNLDFETGTLKDWTAEGEAFKGQPIQGDTVAARRGDMKSEHQGKYWIGGYETVQDKPTGTLTSVPFKVTHPWASFLVGGGPYEKDTCVEVVDVAAKAVIFRASGDETENLRRVAVDLTKHAGKEVQVRVVDNHTGHWGHVNFDDFRFHAEKPKLPDRAAPPVDPYKYAGQTPEDAAKHMTVPPGFRVSVFAAEPDLHQPIAMCFDDRGRLWVVEAYCYPRRLPYDGPLLPEKERAKGDKILIFEDTDGDGKFDKKTVFIEGLNLVSGIEYGFGGVWVGASPYLMFIPVDKSGDKPAGEPKVLLDGFGREDTHETLNSFIWGPDGWLYGCHGVFTHSNVGKPGVKDADRTKIDAGVWRYHPTKHVFEVFAEGTSNPWGLDYNRNGDFFAEACVIPHLWHIVQGGRYQRQAGPHLNPYTYDDIQTIAKHRHFQGNQWNDRDRAGSDDLGGGHAHSGLMCYQGGAWPKEYDGKLFMGNIHGHRINVDVVKEKGSTYEGDRNPDFLLSHDRTVLVVNIQAGPDGNVYFSDWSDKQVCHRPEAEVWDRTNGRVFKVSYKDIKPVVGLDLQKKTDLELAKLQASDNEWMVRHARRILQERCGRENAKLDADAMVALEKLAEEDKNPVMRLRGVLALHAVGRFEMDGRQPDVFNDADEHVRGWVWQIRSERLFTKMKDKVAVKAPTASQLKHPIDRRACASALLRLPAAVRGETLLALTQYAEDNNDPVLPLVYWYALEPLAVEKPAEALAVAGSGKIDGLLEKTARRIGATDQPEATETLVKAVAETTFGIKHLALLRGLQESVKGRRTADPPKAWSDAYPRLSRSDQPGVREAALALAVVYGDEKARDAMATTLSNAKESFEVRQAALSALVNVRYSKLPPILYGLLGEADFRPLAVRALAAFDQADTPANLIAVYPNFTAAEKRDAIATLASRPAFAKALLEAVQAKRLPAGDIPAETIRQLRNLNDKALNDTIAGVWGTVRDTPAARKKLISDWAKKLTPAALAQADLGAGRAVFARVCAQCHTLYGVGGKVGPEITGANRADLNYLLENVFDPSAVIPKEYAATKLDLTDGRVITGIIKEETKATLTVVTANETLVLPVKDVDKRTPSELSMMPDDLTKPLSEQQVRNLFAYLKHTQQVSILADPENAKEFFNGKDILAWDGDKDVWSVENGEIVGRTKTGLKKNTFLKAPLEVTDFKLSVKVKLTPNAENSGIQFRSANIEGGEMRGPQADVGKGWWGKLYEESGRGLLVKEGGEKFVKEDDWNEYAVEAVGPHVRLWINGEKVADYEDDMLSKRGLVAFQVHAGGPTEVRFKDIRFEAVTGKK